jgi:hypothetical protein
MKRFAALAGAPPWARYQRLSGVPPWGRYQRRLSGLGDVTSIMVQLAQYNMDDITSAYNWLNQAFSSENQDLVSMIEWFSANGSSLSAADQQAYMTAIQNETQVVQTLGDWLNTAQVVVGGLNTQIPGLSGLGRRRLGVFPVIAAGVIIVILALIVGVSAAYIYHQISQSQQAHETTLQLQAKAQSSIAASVAQAGGSPDQIQAALSNLYKAQQNANNPPGSQIPWGTVVTLGVVAGVAYVAKQIFG